MVLHNQISLCFKTIVHDTPLLEDIELPKRETYPVVILQA
jgi:hypothetical protein